MLCPRCKQGDVVKVKVIANDVCLLVCQEGEASWFLHEDIGVKAFLDYGTYMESLGLSPLWSKLEMIAEWRKRRVYRCRDQRGSDMTGGELCDFARTVATRENFIEFVECLVQDYSRHHAEWQNTSLSEFLSGLSGFANDMSGYYKNMGEVVDVDKITWRIAAEMLLAATVYEG